MNILIICGFLGLAGIVFLSNKSKDKTFKEEKERVEIKKTKKEDTTVYYQAKRNFFTRSEYMFFQELEKQNVGKYNIFSKVRLEDIVEVIPSFPYKIRSNKRKSIRSRHVDFVLTNKETGKTICAIEVDGKSHDSKKQQESDSKKNMILEQSEIRLYRIRVGDSFEKKIVEIFQQIK